jgi:hypothetical protein
MEASARLRLPMLTAFCKTEAPTWVADARGSVSAPGREPSNGEFSAIKTHVSPPFSMKRVTTEVHDRMIRVMARIMETVAADVGLTRHDTEADQRNGVGESRQKAHGKRPSRNPQHSHFGTTSIGSEAGNQLGR